jgi:putative nucleotidyltransferase with HDIG domain
MAKLDLDVVTQSIKDVPALPHVVTKVMDLSQDPNASAQDVSRVLEQDQSMTARVLRLANSAFYGFPRRISSVTDATIYLGFKTLQSILMAASVSSLMSREMKGYALDEGVLWRHSQTVAFASRLLARKAKFPYVDMAYTAGLLHDIGKIVLDSYLKNMYSEIVTQVEENDLTFVEVENEVLGTNHAEVGARVALHWNLPDELCEAIRLHHQPELAEINPQLVCLVHLADIISLTIGVGLGVGGMRNHFSEEALTVLGLTAADLEDVMSQLADFLADEQSFAIS